MKASASRLIIKHQATIVIAARELSRSIIAASPPARRRVEQVLGYCALPAHGSTAAAARRTSTTKLKQLYASARASIARGAAADQFSTRLAAEFAQSGKLTEPASGDACPPTPAKLGEALALTTFFFVPATVLARPALVPAGVLVTVSVALTALLCVFSRLLVPIRVLLADGFRCC